MATDTQWATTVFDEAAAIVEAEQMRLEQDLALWEREVADLCAATPLPRSHPASSGVVTDTERRRRQPLVDRPRRRRRPIQVSPVWPTQRSPPSKLTETTVTADHRR